MIVPYCVQLVIFLLHSSDTSSIHGLVLPIFIYHLLFLAINFLPSSTMDAHPLWHLGPLLYVSLCQEGHFTSSPAASQPLWRSET